MPAPAPTDASLAPHRDELAPDHPETPGKGEDATNTETVSDDGGEARVGLA